jgi:hypothetical protein
MLRNRVPTSDRQSEILGSGAGGLVADVALESGSQLG